MSSVGPTTSRRTSTTSSPRNRNRSGFSSEFGTTKLLKNSRAPESTSSRTIAYWWSSGESVVNRGLPGDGVDDWLDCHPIRIGIRSRRERDDVAAARGCRQRDAGTHDVLCTGGAGGRAWLNDRNH